MQKTESSSSTTITLQRPSKGIPAPRPSKAIPDIPDIHDIPAYPGNSTSSSISRESTPFQHSPIRMHILQTILQFDWFPQKLHRGLLNIGLIRMNILILDTRNVEANEDVRMYT